MAEAFQGQMKTHLQLLVQMILLSRQRTAASNSHTRLTTAEALLLQFKQMRDISFQYRHIYGYAYPQQTPSSSDWRSLTILQLTHQFLMRMRADYPNETEQDRIADVFSNFFPEYEDSLLPDYTESKAAHSAAELTGLERLDLERWGFNRERFDSLVDSNRFTWTTAEDYLLSLEIARRGKELVYTTLLPTKTHAEIKRRYAELTRRRAPQNAVKEIESLMQRPLSPQEWRLVDRGVMQYGLHRWDMIQAHLLPGRDKVILERLYHRRTKKRAQKRKERERAREKKMAEAGGSLQAVASKR
uniref:Myb-like domain-containing protein n=1 Tax=Rhodosorus marinus TaxID=101924 RepID=A0A7S3E7I6_9RHOD|mmetsp:Transcript_1169/g.3383  ORF Transcript_1169/g.3383 Transcript_1169/m.3383 type:complete len:301 (+) Transcript_1169:140-1042(+)